MLTYRLSTGITSHSTICKPWGCDGLYRLLPEMKIFSTRADLQRKSFSASMCIPKIICLQLPNHSLSRPSLSFYPLLNKRYTKMQCQVWNQLNSNKPSFDELMSSLSIRCKRNQCQGLLWITETSPAWLWISIVFWDSHPSGISSSCSNGIEHAWCHRAEWELENYLSSIYRSIYLSFYLSIDKSI